MRTVVSAVALAAAAGCSSVPRGGGKPADCPLEFLQKAPERPYEALEELSSLVTNPGAEGGLEALRARACAAGADAVIVKRKFVTNVFGHVLVAGTAIRYVGAAPQPPAKPRPPSGAAPDVVDL